MAIPQYTERERFKTVEKPLFRMVGDEEIKERVNERELDSAAIVSCSAFEMYRDFETELTGTSSQDAEEVWDSQEFPKLSQLTAIFLGMHVHHAMMFLELFKHMETNPLARPIHPESYSLYQPKNDQLVFNSLLWNAVREVGGTHGLLRALTRTKAIQESWIPHHIFKNKLPSYRYKTLAESKIYAPGKREKLWQDADKNLNKQDLYEKFATVAETESKYGKETPREVDLLVETSCNLYFRMKRKNLETEESPIPEYMPSHREIEQRET